MRRLAPLALLAVTACGDPALPPGDPVHPDVVLVSVDTLRADHLPAWGYDRPTSPGLDALAAAGVRFARARSPSPWTLPAHVTMMTGRLAPRHLVVETDTTLAPDLPVLAEAMTGAGYRTGGFVATLFVSRKFGFERGFEAFDDFGIEGNAENLEGRVVAGDVVDRALEWLAGLPPGQPAFLFVHVYDVHYAYDPPRPYATLFDRAPRRSDPRYKTYRWYHKHPLDPDQLAHQVAQYDEAIRYVDDQILRLRGAFETAGRSATWVVTADHGEEFGERGSWGHGHTLYPEQLHIPLLVAGPGIPRGRVVDTPVGLQDLAPTLAALVGASLPDPDGVDLGPLLRGTPTEVAGSRSFPAETSRFDTHRYGLWQDGWRLDVDLETGTRALFDTTSDPGETRDLSASEGPRVQALEAEIWRWLGAPWRAAEDATLTVRDGVFVRDGAVSGTRLPVRAGDAFQALPLDVRFQVTGQPVKYRAFGDERPSETAPVRYLGEATARGVELTDEERKRLEALGYVQ